MKMNDDWGIPIYGDSRLVLLNFLQLSILGVDHFCGCKGMKRAGISSACAVPRLRKKPCHADHWGFFEFLWFVGHSPEISWNMHRVVFHRPSTFMSKCPEKSSRELELCQAAKAAGMPSDQKVRVLSTGQKKSIQVVSFSASTFWRHFPLYSANDILRLWGITILHSTLDCWWEILALFNNCNSWLPYTAETRLSVEAFWEDIDHANLVCSLRFLQECSEEWMAYGQKFKAQTWSDRWILEAVFKDFGARRQCKTGNSVPKSRAMVGLSPVFSCWLHSFFIATRRLPPAELDFCWICHVPMVAVFVFIWPTCHPRKCNWSEAQKSIIKHSDVYHIFWVAQWPDLF